MKVLLAALSFLVPMGAIAAECPQRTKVLSLCSEVQERVEQDPPINGNKYAYYRSILEASCLTGNEPNEVLNHNVQAMWESLSTELVCTGAGTDVQGGSIIKFAVHTDNGHFIHDVTKWGIDLNQIDRADGRTVLDYVKDSISKYEGSAVETKLRYYYDKLVRAGAKHRSEL